MAHGHLGQNGIPAMSVVEEVYNPGTGSARDRLMEGFHVMVKTSNTPSVAQHTAQVRC